MPSSNRIVISPASSGLVFDTRRFSAAAVESSAVASDESLTIADQILDGGETVLLAIKPSLWFVLFDAARWIVLGATLLLISTFSSFEVTWVARQTIGQLGAAIIIVRLGMAFLRWVSRFYILTNRRVMRVRGVFKVDILSCPLLSIRRTEIMIGPHEKVTRLGTILFASDEVPCDDFHWFQINKVEEVHERIRRAIDRASNEQPHI
ncbi:MAG: hypothetical protein DHS20C16_05570 [Phycisphaerae bacterium]|nr:MAG: hypothetical protein DHS20C16_05570 [Phycisphaerae bacterium]